MTEIASIEDGTEQDNSPDCSQPIRHCKKCGNDFKQIHGGRPRSKCYKCSPPKLNQRQRKSAAPRPTPDQPHCPHCGAYPPKDSAVYPFCNPQHRSLFAIKVADKKRGSPAPVPIKRGGRPAGSYVS